MSYGKIAQEYKKNAVASASPVQLVVMLYDGAIRFMSVGKEAMLAKDFTRQNDFLQRGQRIVFELMSSLDMHRGGEVAKNLLSLYTYVNEQLVEANLKDSPGCIDTATRVMQDLRVSWIDLEKTQRGAILTEEPVAA